MKRPMNLRVSLIFVSILTTACSHSSAIDDRLSSIEGRWSCEVSIDGSFDIIKDKGTYKIFQVSEESTISAPGELLARFTYDRKKKKYIGQHKWGGNKKGPISWGAEYGMEISVIDESKIFMVYLDSVYNWGWKCNRVKV